MTEAGRACEVCGAAFVPANKRGPKSRRCPACRAGDRRNRTPEQKRFYAPHPCPECGTETQRRRSCDACLLARKNALSAEWAKAHPERTRNIRARYRARHPERVARRFKVFGLSAEEFAAVLASQGGKCAICGTDDPGARGWQFDHDHAYEPKDRRGHRGVLCFCCNTAIGSLGDDPERLEVAARYVRSHRLKVVAA